MFSTFKAIVSFVCLIVILVLLLWKYIRRLYYISLIPGPRAYPLIGTIYMLRGTSAEICNRVYNTFLHYSPILKFWMGPFPVVIISDPDDIKTVLTNPNSMEKSWFFRYLCKQLLGDSILTSRVPKWKRNRKIVTSSLSQGILNSFIPHFVQESNVLVSQMMKEIDQEQPFDAYTYISRATLDSVSGAAMGVHLKAQIQDSPFFHGVNKGLEIIFERGYNLLLYPEFLFNMTEKSKRLKAAKNILYGISEKVIETKLQEKRNKSRKKSLSQLDLGIQKNPLQKPFLDFLLDLNESNSLSQEELRDETNIMITAAYETSAVTISYILVMLAMFPKIQKKVYEEICSVVGETKGSVNERVLGDLRYLELVCKETMRVCPTVPYILRETCDDIQLKNYMLPPNTTCIVAIIALHKDETIWENPHEFIPERFLAEEVKRRHPFSYIPFSAGPRNCIGIKYANLFMKIILTRILQEYELFTSLKYEEMEFNMELSLKLMGGYLLRIKKRQLNQKK